MTRRPPPMLCHHGLDDPEADRLDGTSYDESTRQPGRFGPAQWVGGVDDGADELVAAAANGTEVALGAPVVAQCTPGGLDSTRQGGLANEAATPHGVEELTLGDKALMVTDQLRHDIEHLGLHPDRNSAAPQLISRNIQNEVIEMPHHEWG
jgi:hypothetical protein